MTKGKIALIAGCSVAAATVIVVPTAIALAENANKVTPLIAEASSVVFGEWDSQNNQVNSIVSFDWNSSENPDMGGIDVTGYTMTTAGQTPISLSAWNVQPYRHWLGISISFSDNAPSEMYNLSLQIDATINNHTHHFEFNDIVMWLI